MFTPSISRLTVNIEPAICNGHLPLPIGTALEGGFGWREGGGGGR